MMIIRECSLGHCIVVFVSSWMNEWIIVSNECDFIRIRSILLLFSITTAVPWLPAESEDWVRVSCIRLDDLLFEWHLGASDAWNRLKRANGMGILSLLLKTMNDELCWLSLFPSCWIRWGERQTLVWLNEWNVDEWMAEIREVPSLHDSFHALVILDRKSPEDDDHSWCLSLFLNIQIERQGERSRVWDESWMKLNECRAPGYFVKCQVDIFEYPFDSWSPDHEWMSNEPCLIECISFKMFGDDRLMNIDQGMNGICIKRSPSS